MKTIVALFGASGSGKDFIAEILSKEYKYHKIVRITSRKMREGESQGSPYYFKRDRDLQRDITENTQNYLEVGIFNDFIYTTHIDELKSNINIGCYDVDAVEQLLDNNQIKIIPIYIWASSKMRMMRQLTREENPDIDEICRRYFDDKKKYNVFNFNYFRVDNTTKISNAIKSVKDIVDNKTK